MSAEEAVSAVAGEREGRGLISLKDLVIVVSFINFVVNYVLFRYPTNPSGG
ncbi:hypothetical protein FQZ97_827370 [compost metagenome]